MDGGLFTISLDAKEPELSAVRALFISQLSGPT